MFWAQMKVLLPSFFGYWVFMVALASGTWYAWTRIYTHHTFKWHAPVVLATACAFYMMASTLIGFYQNTALVKYQQSVQANQQTAGQGNVDPALKAKADFLKLVEALTGQPDQITPENKQKLFTQFAGLFPNGNTDKQVYEKEITAVYNCQRYFWEDALASYKAKKQVKSDARKECETLPGNFFNRERLVPAETAKSNQETIENLAQHKRLPASDGKQVEVNDKMLRNALDNQVKALDALQKIFN